MKTPKLSERYHQKAKQIIPGGVNSPARAFLSVGGVPRYIKSAKGPFIKDIDGNKYIDYVMSWGPMILGHTHKNIRLAVQKALKSGASFGAPTVAEYDLARLVNAIYPAMQKLRFVNSGTEAVMSALRLARGHTGRDMILKFDGCYHGHCDSLLVAAGSGAQTLGVPNSKGVPADLAKLTLTARFNDEKDVERIFKCHPDSIAAVILEPVIGNMGLIKPREGFLEFLRTITRKHGTLLIFDEVMTGFRLAPGGACELYGVSPDIVTLGKIIGGGLPIGCYGGSLDIMKNVAPEGGVYQAGTLSGNPLAVAAGIAMLRTLVKNKDKIYPALEEKGKFLEESMNAIIKQRGEKIFVSRKGSMFTLFFTDKEPVCADCAKKSDTVKFSRFFHEMLNRGIYMAPSQFEANFISYAHDRQCLDKTVKAFAEALGAI
ncbi:MAG TPA: glutamate-1-semialdehyde 2,1-aminomutase [Candidatus Wallbacteria bacterium]|nr:glutamate-1-semialdehyde 2,1-aminomutase [Candidatus Wallbacteria bacterium]